MLLILGVYIFTSADIGADALRFRDNVIHRRKYMVGVRKHHLGISGMFKEIPPSSGRGTCRGVLKELPIRESLQAIFR